MLINMIELAKRLFPINRSITGDGVRQTLSLISEYIPLQIVEIPSVWKETKNRKSNFKMIKWLPHYIYWLLYSIINNYKIKIKKIFI